MLASDGAPHAPYDLFLPLHDAKQLFQDKVLYLACEGVVPRDMQLGVTCDASLIIIIIIIIPCKPYLSASATAPHPLGRRKVERLFSLFSV
jgi:hypothetical protein